MTDGCFRQVEYAGVLRGTKHPAAARAVVDWLLSPAVQADVPCSMFVLPARADAAIPEVFAELDGQAARPAVAARRTTITARSGSTLDRRVRPTILAPARAGAAPHAAGVGARPAARRSSSSSSSPGRCCDGAGARARRLRARRADQALDAAHRVVHDLAGVVSTALTLLLGLPIAFVLHRYALPGRRACLLAVVTVPVRAADGRRGYGVPGGPAGADGSGRVAAILAGARVLQPRRGGARRRWAVGAPRPEVRGRPRAPWAPRPGAPSARSPGRWSGRRSLAASVLVFLLHVHLVRGRARPRRPGAPDPRGRGLPPDGPAARPARRRGASPSCSWCCLARGAPRVGAPPGPARRPAAHAGRPDEVLAPVRGRRLRWLVGASSSSRSCSSPSRWWRWSCGRCGSAATGDSPGGAALFRAPVTTRDVDIDASLRASARLRRGDRGGRGRSSVGSPPARSPTPGGAAALARPG